MLSSCGPETRRSAKFLYVLYSFIGQAIVEMYQVSEIQADEAELLKTNHLHSNCSIYKRLSVYYVALH